MLVASPPRLSAHRRARNSINAHLSTQLTERCIPPSAARTARLLPRICFLCHVGCARPCARLQHGVASAGRVYEPDRNTVTASMRVKADRCHGWTLKIAVAPYVRRGGPGSVPCLWRQGGGRSDAAQVYKAAAHAGLQSFTFDEETNLEVTFLEAEIDALSAVRDRVLWKCAVEQVRFERYRAAPARLRERRPTQPPAVHAAPPECPLPQQYRERNI